MSDTESRAKTSPSDRRQQEADSGQILAPLDAGKERQAMRIAEPRGRLLASRLSGHDGRISWLRAGLPLLPAGNGPVARPFWHVAGQQLRSAGLAGLDHVDGREEAGS